MQEEQYSQLLGEGGGFDDHTLDRRGRSMQSSTLIHWIGHGTAVIIVIILLTLNATQYDDFVTKEFRTTRLYAPLQRIVRYSIKAYDHVNLHSTESPSIFKGEPRPELDDAWTRITNHSMILISEEDMKRLEEPTENAFGHNGKYFAIVDGFHQLHCVDLLRKYIYRENYPDYIAFHGSTSMVSWHVDHCLDVLRQKVMCDADLNLIVYDKPSVPGQKPQARFSIPRLCRNFDELKQWTWDNAWNKE